PVATVADLAVGKGQTLAASSLVQASDPDQDNIVTYEFFDSTSDPASGHFVVNGVTQGTNQAIDVAAADLDNSSFKTGLGSVDDLWIRVSDGTLWSDWKELHVSAPNHLPVVTAPDLVVSTKGQNIAAGTLFSVSDADAGDGIQKYQFWDGTADGNSGYFVTNG